MRLLITGASGFLGRRLTCLANPAYEILAGYGRHPEALLGGKPVHLDFSRPSILTTTLTDLGLDSRDAVLHTAAINPGGDESEMQTVNVAGSRAVAEVAAKTGARLIHISTDVVHDGRNGPYADSAPVNPLNAYAASKAAAEAEVLAAKAEALVVRTSLIYGLETIDRGTEGFAQRLERGEPVRLFHDVIRQPVGVDDLSIALLRLVKLDVSGHLNVAGRQALSRESFGRKMLEFWRVPGREKVEAVAAAEMSDKIPLDLRLDLSRAESLGLELPGVDELLSRGRRPPRASRGRRPPRASRGRRPPRTTE